MENIYIDLENDYCRKFFNRNFVPVNEILDKLLELETEKEEVEDNLKALQQEIEDNYKPISVAEQVGFNERDFI